LPEKKVRFDDFQLDYSRFQLCRCGIPVRLEGLPLQLLMFLVDNRGQLVTRDQISCELWSKDVFVDVEQGINTAIRKIRRALADDAGEPQYLQTVVGRGYRFVAPTAEEDTSSQPSIEALVISPEELGRAIMTAAGLDPENPRGIPKPPAGHRTKSES
jgi:DNA-binding winged helix-turn-helix (wHTH) protein